VRGQAVRRDRVETDRGQEHHLGRPGLLVGGRRGVEHDRLASDVEVVGPGRQAGIEQLPVGAMERAGTVENDRLVGQRRPQPVLVIHLDDHGVGPQFLGHVPHGRGTASQYGLEASFHGHGRSGSTHVPRGAIDQEAVHTPHRSAAPATEVETTIAGSGWNLVSDARRYPEWVVQTDRMLDVPDTGLRQGATYREYAGLAPFKSESEWRVTVFEPHRRQVHLGDDGTVEIELTIEVEPTDGGSRLTQTFDVRPPRHAGRADEGDVAADDAAPTPAGQRTHHRERQAPGGIRLGLIRHHRARFTASCVRRTGLAISETLLR
jgi:hypothetical protein